MKVIQTEIDYNNSLEQVYSLMKKGEKNLTEIELQTITETANAIKQFEAVHYPFPTPQTIGEIVAYKMAEKKLNRAKLATLFGMGTAKISQILNGKRQPDVPFLKALHEKLGIDGNFLLERL